MIVLGRIVAPFGVRGWVRVLPFGDDPLAWGEMPQWWLAPTEDAIDTDWKTYGVRECREHGNSLIAQLESVTDRNAAEALKGHYIAAPRDALPATESDEYYWADLIGLEVLNTSGETLGTVEGLLTTGAHDVLRVVDGETERLIPFVAAYTLDVNQATRTITVDWQKDW